MKVKFKRNKDGSCNFTFSDLTQGKALSLCRAISEYGEISTVGSDVKEALKRTIQVSDSYIYRENDQELMEIMD